LGSREDVERAGVGPGDWVWLSDREVVVGARLQLDRRYGLVGIPDWDTTVHLDDELRDCEAVRAHLQGLLQKPSRSAEEESRVLELLTIFEMIAPAEAKAGVRPGYFPYRRAASLLRLGKPALALREIEEACALDPGHPKHQRLMLQALRQTDLPRAGREAEALASDPELSAGVLAECINVLATRADDLPDDRFEPVGRRVLEWAGRFEQAPGRERVPASTLALLQFNRGMVLLRLGRVDAAREALGLAREADPIFPGIDQAERLTRYDQHARDLTARVRARATAA
jgi:tetratricopeptide (TPR) repeat protein